MTSEKKNFATIARSVLSISIFVLLLSGVGFLTVRFIWVIIEKFS